MAGPAKKCASCVPASSSISVVTGWPSPRALGSCATGTEYTRPLLPNTTRVSTVRHSKAPYSASPALKPKLAASCPWPLRERTQPFSDTTTVTGSSTTRTSTADFFSAWMSVRRGSANCLASASISFTIRRRSAAGLPRMSSSFSWPARRSLSSCSILRASRRASWRRRISRMSSAWRSLRRKRSISAALGSSAPRMMAITSSMLSSTVCRPSRMWMRSSTLARRCCERRVIVPWRNSIHSVSIWRSDFCTGLPSMPTMVRLMDDDVSRLVCAKSAVMSSCCGVLPVFGSHTRRTAASLLDSSRTPSSTASMLALSSTCSLPRAFLPVLIFGLVMSSISSSTFCVLTPGGSSVTTSCHWPRASSSIFQRARTFRLPRPVR